MLSRSSDSPCYFQGFFDQNDNYLGLWQRETRGVWPLRIQDVWWSHLSRKYQPGNRSTVSHSVLYQPLTYGANRREASDFYGLLPPALLLRHLGKPTQEFFDATSQLEGVVMDRSKDAHEPIARRWNQRGSLIPVSLLKREPVIEGRIVFRI